MKGRDNWSRSQQREWHEKCDDVKRAGVHRLAARKKLIDPATKGLRLSGIFYRSVLETAFDPGRLFQDAAQGLGCAFEVLHFCSCRDGGCDALFQIGIQQFAGIQIRRVTG
jgi:hypothetical protein